MEQSGDLSNLKAVKHIILILSGKGGVGKSSVTVQLAYSLANQGKKVGILDIDLCGPSIPVLMNMQQSEIHQCLEGWLPVYTDSRKRLGVMSISFLLKEKDDPVVWRGPKKHAMIKQFLTDVHWGDLDYLIIDTPPGTSDEHITVVENIQRYDPDGAILVTTPQAVSLGDVRREISFCRKTGVKIIGLVENMSGYVCPNCSECTNIFSTGGGESLAELTNIPFLGRIPINPKLHPTKGDSLIRVLDEIGTIPVLQQVAADLITR